jgi:hypothetical protein
VTYLSILGYPVVAGVIFFSHARPSTSMTLLVFQVTLGLLYFSSVPIVILGAAATLSSPFIDEPTRVRLLVSQSAGMIPTALAASVALWAFGAAGSGSTLSVGSVSVVLSPLLAGFTAAYFILVLIVPYAIGSQRAKARRLAFLDQRKDLLNSAQEALALPDQTRRVEVLTDLTKDVNDKIQVLSSGDPSPKWLADNRAETQRVPVRLIPSPIQLRAQRNQGVDNFYATLGPQVVAAFDESQDVDARLQHLAWLNRFASDLSSALEQVGKGGRQLARVASDWKESFATTLNTVKDEIADAGKARTPLGFVAVSFLGPLFSAVFVSGFGGWLWSTFEHTVLR